jgi:hypothetical protein
MPELSCDTKNRRNRLLHSFASTTALIPNGHLIRLIKTGEKQGKQEASRAFPGVANPVTKG